MKLTARMIVCTVFALPGAHAEPVTYTAPPETASLKKSALPGYAIALQQCAICHSADYIRFQPPQLTLAQWTAEVSKMQHAYGAPISDQDVAMVGAYLAVTYGSAKEAELPPHLRDASAVARSEAGGGAVDVQSLLSRNGCLGCHAVEKRVVGPAYREVAAKYKGDTEALRKLEDSIQHGSSGKWGSVAMPAFPQLQQDEIKALVEYVLKQ